jgi:uncharacterized protein YutE (UPF0331/DUF86 family)/predicted nucleotidyltransferase
VHDPNVTTEAHRQLAAFFEADAHGACAVYLFGSVARGDATATSDVDVAVLSDRAPESVLSGAALTLEGTLELHLGQSVDLVSLNRAPADLVHRVLRDGAMVFDRDRSRRLRFEVDTRNEFFDLEPVRRRYRRGAGLAPPAVPTEAECVRKKLAQIETYVADLRRLARPEDLGRDVREERFVKHTLQLAIQAALDVASHIVSDERLGEPQTNRELFALLERRGYLTPALAATLGNMAGFRNILVHGYDDVDLSVVKDVVTHHLGDLIAFADAVRAIPRADPDKG